MRRKNFYRVLVMIGDRCFEKDIKEDSPMLAVIEFERQLKAEGYNFEDTVTQYYAENKKDAHDSVGDNPLL